jgi:hypothetical protein
MSVRPGDLWGYSQNAAAKYLLCGSFAYLRQNSLRR